MLMQCTHIERASGENTTTRVPQTSTFTTGLSISTDNEVSDINLPIGKRLCHL